MRREKESINTYLLLCELGVLGVFAVILAGLNKQLSVTLCPVVRKKK